MRPIGKIFTARYKLVDCGRAGFAPVEGDVLKRVFEDDSTQLWLVLRSRTAKTMMHVECVVIESLPEGESIYWKTY